MLTAVGTNCIVDLCSGGSGPWEYLKPDLDARRTAAGDEPVALTLTDRYPNIDAFQQAADRLGAGTRFREDSVDARRVPADVTGVRTMFSAFHHFPPDAARAVLADAAASGQPVCIFDFSRGSWWSMRGLLW